jgi:hypothetical protein
MTLCNRSGNQEAHSADVAEADWRAAVSTSGREPPRDNTLRLEPAMMERQSQQYSKYLAFQGVLAIG